MKVDGWVRLIYDVLVFEKVMVVVWMVDLVLDYLVNMLWVLVWLVYGDG